MTSSYHIISCHHLFPISYLILSHPVLLRYLVPCHLKSIEGMTADESVITRAISCKNRVWLRSQYLWVANTRDLWQHKFQGNHCDCTLPTIHSYAPLSFLIYVDIARLIIIPITERKKHSKFHMFFHSYLNEFHSNIQWISLGNYWIWWVNFQILFLLIHIVFFHSILLNSRWFSLILEWFTFHILSTHYQVISTDFGLIFTHVLWLVNQ